MTTRVTRVHSLISPEHRTSWTPAWPRQGRPGKNIATSGQGKRTPRSGRERRVLSSESADHTSQRDGSTEEEKRNSTTSQTLCP